MELYKKYRPKSFKGIKGQVSLIQSLSCFIEEDKIPHALLFSGPSGCGKTTLARIIKSYLDCGKFDFVEINCADFRGIDMVRDIRDRMRSAPLGGKTKVWIIDECHKLSNDAQNAFLKILEDTPSHVYFILATTSPEKLLTTIKNRCSLFVVKSLESKELFKLIKKITKRERVKVEEEVIDKIVEYSEGSARKSLVLLEQIINVEDIESQLDLIESASGQVEGIKIARCLFNPKANWSEMAGLLKDVKEEPEKIRWVVLGYANSILLSGKKLSSRAFLVIDAFRDNFYDSKKVGLSYACYEVIFNKD